MGCSTDKGSQKVLVEEHWKDVAQDQRTWCCEVKESSRENAKQEWLGRGSTES